MKNLKNTNKGITLIALIITIIVMLILVSVTISMAVNGGLFEYAGKAVSDTQNAIDKEQQLANGEIKIGDTWYDSMDDYLKGVESVKSLQEKHQFTYYSSLVKAVADVNNNTRENADSDKENAVAGIYTEDGKHTVVLLKDSTEETRVEPSVDMTINLGGHTLSTKDVVCINVLGGNLTINGKLSGSSIEMTSDGGKVARVLQVLSGKVDVNGGSYIGNTNGSPSNGSTIYSQSNLTMTGATIIAKDNTTGAAKSLGADNGGIVIINDCDITATANSGLAQCIDATIDASEIIASHCNIKAYSNGKGYGIQNHSKLTINKCYIMGTDGGVQNCGTLYVNGGTYEGYRLGGFWFGGDGSSVYIRNATIRESAMPDGYTAISPSKNTGFYIGGVVASAVCKNSSVYMDNCEIYGSSHPFVLANSDGEQNNSLYISNSRINTDKLISIGNDTLKLYIGKANNFTADNTNRASSVVETQEVYIQK